MRIEGRPIHDDRADLDRAAGRGRAAGTRCELRTADAVKFRFERLEVNPRFAAISRLSNAGGAGEAAGGHGGPWRAARVAAAVCDAGADPRSAAAAIHGRAVRPGPDLGDAPGGELWATEVRLDAVVDEQVMGLAEVMKLEVGSRIVLGAAPGASVQLRCGTVPLFEARGGAQAEPGRGADRGGAAVVRRGHGGGPGARIGVRRRRA